MDKHKMKMKIMKHLEKTFVAFSTPSRENFIGGKSHFDRGFRLPSEQKEPVSAMTNLKTPRGSSRNLSPSRTKAHRQSQAESRRSQDSYTPKSNAGHGQADASQLLQFALKTHDSSFESMQMMSKSAIASSQHVGSAAPQKEMHSFLENLIGYYRDLKSIEKLRNMINEQEETGRQQMNKNQQKGNALQNRIYESILEDLQRILLLDIQSMLEATNDDIVGTSEGEDILK